jgi:hypothetical protein
VVRNDEAEMAIVLMLLDRAEVPFAIHAETSRALARLGVTRLAVLQDGSTLGVLLEGWAFDTASTDRAIDAIDGLRSRVRVLVPVLDASLSTTGAGTIAVRPEGGSG